MIGVPNCPGEDKSRAALLAEEISFVSRKAQTYEVRFAAIPDKDRFQISWNPSAAWPNRANFFVALGETTGDRQLRAYGFEKKVAKTKKGILIDAPALTVTHLPGGAGHQLVRNVPVVIPTYFAELRDLKKPAKSFYVKEGTTFVLGSAADPGTSEGKTKYQVTRVTKDSAFIALAGAKDDSPPVEIKHK